MTRDLSQLSLTEKIAIIGSYADNYLMLIGNDSFPSFAEESMVLDQHMDSYIELVKSSNVVNTTGFTKVAFDTRRINQETERNPRANLQNWHRADDFISAEDEKKLTHFAKLMSVLNDIKKEFGTQNEWFDSYARVLHDQVYRILRIKQADLDIFKPQLLYLEQLLYLRYRITADDMVNLNSEEMRSKIISKDEGLLKRGNFMKETGLYNESSEKQKQLTIDGNNKSTQESIVNAIFGSNPIRKDDRVVERTITITIRDEAKD